MPVMTTRATPTAEIGARVRKAREDLGLSRREAAAKLGIGDQSLYDLERGLNEKVSLDRLHGIALAWGIDPAQLDPRFGASPQPVDALAGSPCPGTLTLVVGEDGETRPATEADRACLDRKKPETVRALVTQGRELGRAREDLAPDGTTAVTYRLKP